MSNIVLYRYTDIDLFVILDLTIVYANLYIWELQVMSQNDRNTLYLKLLSEIRSKGKPSTWQCSKN